MPVQKTLPIKPGLLTGDADRKAEFLIVGGNQESVLLNARRTDSMLPRWTPEKMVKTNAAKNKRYRLVCTGVLSPEDNILTTCCQ